MKVWLLKIGETIPVENSTERLNRTGLLASLMAEAGHSVAWWTSTFDRVTRRNLFKSDTTLYPRPGLEVKLIHSPGYQKSISLARVRDQRIVAQKFSLLARQQEPPDIILCALPVIELCKASILYGQEYHVPVVLDMRDMWPDIIVDTFPSVCLPFARLLLSPMFNDAQYACNNATAITGINDLFMEWGLKRGGRKKSELDQSFPLGYLVETPSQESIREAESFWDQHGVTVGDNIFTVCFFGTLGHQFDIETVIKTANRLKDDSVKVQFVICGSGDNLDRYRQMGANNPLLIFPGWVDYAKIYVLMRRSQVGINPLINRYDFISTINNKAIEYISAGLPVISSPHKGVLHDLLTKECCGMSYTNGDTEELAAIIRKLAANKVLLQDMSEKAKKLFENKFRAEKVYADMTTYLEKVAHRYKMGGL